MLKEADVPVSYLRACLDCDPETGTLTWRRRPREHFVDERIWKIWNTRFAGKPARYYSGSGYLMIRLTLDGKHGNLAAHRVVWTFKHGEWPLGNLDHIDGVRDNNRPGNLRLATLRYDPETLEIAAWQYFLDAM